MFGSPLYLKLCVYIHSQFHTVPSQPITLPLTSPSFRCLLVLRCFAPLLHPTAPHSFFLSPYFFLSLDASLLCISAACVVVYSSPSPYASSSISLLLGHLPRRLKSHPFACIKALTRSRIIYALFHHSDIIMAKANMPSNSKVNKITSKWIDLQRGTNKHEKKSDFN